MNGDQFVNLLRLVETAKAVVQSRELDDPADLTDQLIRALKREVEVVEKDLGGPFTAHA